VNKSLALKVLLPPSNGATPVQPLPPSAPEPEKKVLSARFVLKEGLLLYNNLTKLDRWGGGGLGLSTLVKLAGWAGLMAVLGALVVKLHAVERQLDPVEHGVDKLRAELDQARESLKVQEDLSAQELKQVHQQTQALEAMIRATIDAHQRDSGAVAEADHGARVLSEQLKAALERQHTVATKQELADGALGSFTEQVTQTQSALKSAGDRTSK
jgi:hypothetical protein